MKTSSMNLIYRAEDGSICTQPWEDLTSQGTLIDPETGDDMELIGWEEA